MPHTAGRDRDYNGPMRILDVSPRATFPCARGSDARVSNLLLQLSRRHDVRQFSLSTSALRPRDLPITPSLRVHRYANPVSRVLCAAAEKSWPSAPLLAGEALKLLNPALLRRRLEWADVVLVEFPWQFRYCRRLRPKAPLVLATHNIETPKFASWANAQGLQKDEKRGWLRSIRRMESEAVAQADLILAVSPEDREGFIDEFGADPRRVLEIPNGADTSAFFRVSAETRASLKQQLGLPEGPVISFAAGPSPPNFAGLEWVRRLASVADRFTFVVVGSLCRQAEKSGNMIFTGPVENAAPWVQASDVSLCPIEYGGGTKIKLLEALAAGVPVVAFEESLHGTALVPGRDVVAAPKNDDELAFAVHQLVRSPDLGARLGENARAYILRHHDWARIAEKLEAALTELVSSSMPSMVRQSSAHLASRPA